MHGTPVSETDLFGIFHLRKGTTRRFEGYYDSLDAIRPMLRSSEWKQRVSGYYVNVSGDSNAVRLSYFTTSPPQSTNLVNTFAAKHGLDVIESEYPHTVRIAEKYGGEELRFRGFLCTYAPIALDIMEADLLNARCLLATFRWQVMRARLPYQRHFINTFREQSRFFNALLADSQDQFWHDLAHWPNPPQVDWAHMFVNMVLGCDWIAREIWMDFRVPAPALSIEQINQAVGQQGFQIPADWRPL